ncbi:MAG: AI-2E family transporter [Rubellimicrobium sp.]|nr:AI-2E family transporter [Rubellimicrobium sp.]
MKNAPFLNLVLAIVLVVLVGTLLLIGRSILIPIFTAVISVYVMTSASEALGRVPFLARLPDVLLRGLVLAVFILALIVLAVVVAATAREIAVVLPSYQANLERLVERVADRYNLETQVLWDEIRAVTLARIDLEYVVLSVLGGFTSIGFTVFLVMIYASFLMSERGAFPAKIATALPDRKSAERLTRVLGDINTEISRYLAIKTLINVILGAMSFAIMTVMGVDFALFWALSIALLNYIPYVGSYIGVAFPVILSLGQVASLQYTIGLLALLTGAQLVMGNVVEPRWIGRQLNMSPFVVLVALSVWAALWGVPGAILAIPMTSILIIVARSFESTRFVAILLSERTDGKAQEPPADPLPEVEGTQY